MSRPWRVATALNQLLAEINAKSPNRSKISDGSIGDAAHASRNSDHNPWIVNKNTGVVTARDFTHDPKNGFSAGDFAEWLRKRCQNGTENRVKYIISNRRIASEIQNWAWRTYTGVNAHTQHVHVSVLASSSRYDDGRSWGWNTPAKPAKVMPPLESKVELTEAAAQVLSTRESPRKAGDMLSLRWIIDWAQKRK